MTNRQYLIAPGTYRPKNIYYLKLDTYILINSLVILIENMLIEWINKHRSYRWTLRIKTLGTSLIFQVHFTKAAILRGNSRIVDIKKYLCVPIMQFL